ncbi:retropepsin-like aspartic protease [Rhodotorula paludigena]|uniref:retropepsin-like aspartic protease n=1 Tax=Rhodotorula paludigena TaxID=86838 RepID=UPI00316EEDDE
MIHLAVEVDNHLQTQILEIKQQEQAGRLASTTTSSKARCLIDSGALGIFASPAFINSSRLRRSALASPIAISDIAGQPVSSVTHFVRVKFALGSNSLNLHIETVDLLKCNIVLFDIILGLPWVKQ